MARRAASAALVVAALAQAVVLATTLAPASAVAPAQSFAHRAYTYQQNYTEAIAKFNSDATTTHAQIGVVNAYGGWMINALTAVDINCTRSAAAPKAVHMTIANEWLDGNIVVKACNAQSCTFKDYHRCSADLPPPTTPTLGMSVTLALDPDDVFLVFIFNSTFEQECWPPAAGLFPQHLTLPMKSTTACASGDAVAPVRAVAARADGVEEPTSNPQYAPVVMPHDRPFSSLEEYANIDGVEELIVVIDGRMDLCTEFAQYNMTGFDCSSEPDIANATDAQLQAVVDEVVSIYCPLPYVAGIQLDLEPFGGPYRKSVTRLLALLSGALRSAADGCVDANHPSGRSLSFFTFAEGINGTDLLSALGPNGEVMISGYDLYPVDDNFTASTPAQYGANLKRQVAAVKAVLGTGPSAPKFSLGIPVAASTHEYEERIAGKYCGPRCANYTTGFHQDEYVQAAMEVILADPIFNMSAGADSQFRGLAFWLFGGPGSTEEYPPHSGNEWLPTRPSADVLATLRAKLPSLGYPAAPPTPERPSQLATSA
mmetsp:Transcript_11329/g.39475  ORF Transcript_11329/g.39475 Transcript_11329/m.39475 type:complete len:542 (-) Transcript_11329:33-1658(-)